MPRLRANAADIGGRRGHRREDHLRRRRGGAARHPNARRAREERRVHRGRRADRSAQFGERHRRPGLALAAMPGVHAVDERRDVRRRASRFAVRDGGRIHRVRTRRRGATRPRRSRHTRAQILQR